MPLWWGVHLPQLGRPTVASGSADTSLRIWCLQKGACLRVIAGAGAKSACVNCMAFSPDGGLLTSGGSDKLLKASNNAFVTAPTREAPN